MDYDTHVIKLYQWKYHNAIGSGIDEKITLKFEAGLMKKCRVSGSGIDKIITSVEAGLMKLRSPDINGRGG